jgi:subtilisin family serine protease
MTGSLDEAIPLAGIKRVRGSGRNGRGVWVAILDTGVDRDHPDIRRALKKGECFCLWCCGPNLENRGSGKRSVEDDSGHGTLVSGIVVSRGKVAPRGIARNAKLLAMRVGEDIFGFDLFLSSDVLSGLDWIIVNMPQVRVVNMSFGGGGYKGKCDKKGAENRAYATAIDTLWDLGIMVFAATGNEGRKNRIVTPACIDKAIAVGAVYDEDLGPMSWPRCRDETTAADQVTCFSDSNRHVDLVAPGAMITGPYLRGAVTTAAGTSLASPMAAGCAVLLRSKYPEATPAEVLEALESSSTLVTDSKNGRGYTSLDCEESFAYLERLLK